MVLNLTSCSREAPIRSHARTALRLGGVEKAVARGRGMSVYYSVLPKGAVEFHDIGHGLETT